MSNKIDMLTNIVLTDYFEIYKSSFTTKWKYQTPPHNYGHLDFITKGCLLITEGEKKYYADENKIIFIPKNITYHQSVEITPYSYHSFLFSYLENENFNIKEPVIFTPSNLDFYFDRYKYAYNLYITKPPIYKLKIKKIMYEVFDKICEETFQRTSDAEWFYTIKKSVEFLLKNYSDSSISSEIIAEKSNITPTYLRQIFKKIYSTTPNKYINNLRIAKAKSLLENTDYSIDEIAYRCGYNDYSYFSKVFNRSEGLSPSFYRNNKENINKKDPH